MAQIVNDASPPFLEPCQPPAHGEDWSHGRVASVTEHRPAPEVLPRVAKGLLHVPLLAGEGVERHLSSHSPSGDSAPQGLPAEAGRWPIPWRPTGRENASPPGVRRR